MIRSVSDDQTYILSSILELNKLKSFDCDLTYGNGAFYKNIPEPFIKMDIDPQSDDVIECSSTSTWLIKDSLNSLVFDPPFLTYIKQGREHNSIMSKRFGGYWKYSELEQHYKDTLIEANRLLRKGGIMVFKCQDIIHNHRMYCTHMNVMKWSEGMFRLKDLFILTAKHRMPLPQQEGVKKRVQKHARIHHSYFMVLENLT